jgi:asparagine synthase (glutamine-hydrolysing)
MCGIAGIFSFNENALNHRTIERMSHSLRFRGPDDKGLFEYQNISLAHRRLTIRDLTINGRCPMSSLDGCVQVVFNGEIYNWRDLKSDLIKLGFDFTSESDTEVILVGYKAWGDKVFSLLKGMFAIGLWDDKKKQLFLVRDRLGEKPLYYSVHNDYISFSSTLASLKHSLPTFDIEPISICSFLSHNFISRKHVIWKNVYELPPAHYLRISIDKTLDVKRYWALKDIKPLRFGGSNYISKVESAIENSVKLCLDADVPVGVFLSGGVDSSLITAMVSKYQQKTKVFSIAFENEKYSELTYAELVAKHLNLDHYWQTINVDDVLMCLPHLVSQFGQPFGDPSAIPTYLLSKLARKDVKVCLSGDGGDENFGGYWRLQSNVYAARYAKLVPLKVRKKIIPYLAYRTGNIGKRLFAMNELSLQKIGCAYTNSLSWFSYLGEIAGPRLKPVLDHDVAIFRVGNSFSLKNISTIQRMLFDDLITQLTDAYLKKVDVASMAASLEVRAPFLDVDITELAWRLPDNAKLRWGERKWILKKIAARWVPPRVIYRKKMGFGMPLSDWFRGKLGHTIEELFKNSYAVNLGWINRGPVIDCLNDHRRGANHAMRLWLVLWLELWFRVVCFDENIKLQ